MQLSNRWHRDPWFWVIVLGGLGHVLTHYASYIPAVRPIIRGLPYFNLHALHEAEFLIIIALAAYRFRLKGGLATIVGTALASIPFVLTPYIFGRDPRSGEVRDLIIQTLLTLVIGGFIVFLNELHARQRERSEKLLKDLQDKQEQLIRTDRLATAGRLAASVAHDVRTPLMAIIGFSQLLLERNMDDDVRKDLTVIMNEAERASTITEGLLSFSGQRPTSRASMSVNEAVEGVLNLWSPQLKANNIQVVLKLHPDLPGTWADYQQIKQVLLNLVVNAEQAMTEAHNRGKLTVSTQHVDSVIRTTVSDDGPGIPKHLISRIFDSFYTTKRPGEGTGLGLSICHRIITEHGGVIQIEAQEDKGTTVVIDLPLNSQGLALSNGRQIQSVA